jgi:hypothetical protein
LPGRSEPALVGSPPLKSGLSSQSALSDSAPPLLSGEGLPVSVPAGVKASPWSARVVGGWRLEARLGDTRLGSRWLAWGGRDALPRVAHHLQPRVTRGIDAGSALEPLTRFVHAHAVGLEEVVIDRGETWLIAPYCGSYDGLMPLAKLMSMKASGSLPVREAMFLGIHLLGAIDAGWRRGLGHGPLGMDDVLIDRRGRAMVELFGVEARCRGEDPLAAAHASVAGVVGLVYELATGLAPSGTRGSSAAVAKSMPRGLESFFSRGLARAEGFASPAEAMSALNAAMI